LRVFVFSGSFGRNLVWQVLDIKATMGVTALECPTGTLENSPQLKLRAIPELASGAQLRHSQ
jgi:hypothetical protein